MNGSLCCKITPFFLNPWRSTFKNTPFFWNPWTMPPAKKHPLSPCKCGLACAPLLDWTAVTGAYLGLIGAYSGPFKPFWAIFDLIGAYLGLFGAYLGLIEAYFGPFRPFWV